MSDLPVPKDTQREYYALLSWCRYRGKPLWFKGMTDLGPMTTDKESERMIFSSAREAYHAPAYGHMLSCFEVVQIEEEFV